MLSGAASPLCTEASGLIHRRGCLSDMRVSVVICGYTMDRLEVFTAAIDSVLAQTHRPLEVVIVIDGNPTLHERVVTRYGGDPSVRIELNDEKRGISYSSTCGGRSTRLPENLMPHRSQYQSPKRSTPSSRTPPPRSSARVGDGLRRGRRTSRPWRRGPSWRRAGRRTPGSCAPRRCS